MPIADASTGLTTSLLAADALLPARNQMALSLGWHIILACFGMSFPAMIFVVHRMGLRGDADAMILARRWSKVAAVLFAVGAVSGTVLSFEMGLLWPGLMEQFGEVIGLAFALEGIAFFVEAIFIGLYVYGWDRLPGRIHSLLLVPIVTAGIFGSFLVISVNGWMNAPTGFRLVDGEVVDVDPWAAIMNDAVWLQYLHMYLAAVMVVGYTVAGVYAFLLLRNNTSRVYRLGLIVPLLFAVAVTPLQPLVGHFAGQVVADRQPIKLAAMEGLAETDTRVPLELGGVFTNGELRGAVEVPVPGLLSFLAQNDFNAEVIGLDAAPPDERPPTGIVHASYTVMIAIGTALVGLAAWVGWHWWRRRTTGPLTAGASAPDLTDRRWMLRAIMAAGPGAIIAMETGWITTEVGRQPWIVHGIMRTEDAVTDAGYIWWTLSALIVLYTLLTVGTIAVLASMSRRWAAGETLVTPYGPPEPIEADH